jgi:hypothetical protein
MVSTNRIRHWLAALAIVAALLGVGLAIRAGLEKSSQRKRQLEYRNIVKTYSDALKTGATRDLVESYLRSREKDFHNECCFSGYTNAWADLVRIGQEIKPWYCSEANVYVAFVFDGADRRAQEPTSSKRV